MKKSISVPQLIILSFLILVGIGTVLLMLPISTNDGVGDNFLSSLFTATSASCVTGLVLFDTGSHFSFFGQVVIMLLIQIGGLGVLSITVLFMVLVGKKISLKQRQMIKESLAAQNVGGIVKLLNFLVKYSLLIEGVGAALLMLVFVPEYGFRGIFYGVFHAVSAFCNAGFDVLGNGNSLINYSLNPLVIFTVSFLITVGSIGFLTWADIRDYKFKFRFYSTQSKFVLCLAFVILLFSFLFFFFFEFADLPLLERFYYAFFQSVTCRTAGFNNFDYSLLSDSGKLFSIILMLIGGAPGSTAGGMKTVAFGVIIFTTFAIFSKREDTHLFRRTIENEAVYTAFAIFVFYIFVCLISGFVICEIENLPLIDCLFETASAIGTVGLTVGITAKLSLVSKIILIVLMFVGRVGGITLIFAASSKIIANKKYPKDRLIF